MSHVKVSFEMSEYTAECDGVGVLRLLNAIRSAGLEKKTRLYQVIGRGRDRDRHGRNCRRVSFYFGRPICGGAVVNVSSEGGGRMKEARVLSRASCQEILLIPRLMVVGMSVSIYSVVFRFHRQLDSWGGGEGDREICRTYGRWLVPRLCLRIVLQDGQGGSKLLLYI